MTHFRLAALVILAGIIGIRTPIHAQTASELDKKQEQAVQKVQKLLDENLIDTKQLSKNMPLAKLLEAVEKQLPKQKAITLRIDRDAFGAEHAELAATPIKLPEEVSFKVSVRWVLAFALAKLHNKADYRITAAEVAITTPQRGLYTAAYDIRDIVAKQDSLATGYPMIVKGKSVVRALLSMLDDLGNLHAVEIEVLNDVRLLVRANANNHALIAGAIEALRRLTDLSVTVQARLYEVDDAYYKKLTSLKRISLEEAERRFLEEKAPKGESLFKLLEQQKLVLTGAERTGDNGFQAVILARHRVVTCLPTPEQIRAGDKGRQTILEGVSFVARLEVSSDRRGIRAKFTEKSTDVREILQSKARENGLGFAIDDTPGKPQVIPPKELPAEMPIVHETAHMQTLDLPDGGSTLVPVNYRPRAVREAGRWWVLSITARIRIEEEERLIRAGGK